MAEENKFEDDFFNPKECFCSVCIPLAIKTIGKEKARLKKEIDMVFNDILRFDQVCIELLLADEERITLLINTVKERFEKRFDEVFKE